MEARTGFPFSLFTDQQELIGKAGSQRFPEYFSLNLQLEKRFTSSDITWLCGVASTTSRAGAIPLSWTV